MECLLVKNLNVVMFSYNMIVLTCKFRCHSAVLVEIFTYANIKIKNKKKYIENVQFNFINTNKLLWLFFVFSSFLNCIICQKK